MTDTMLDKVSTVEGINFVNRAVCQIILNRNRNVTLTGRKYNV